MRVQSHVGFLHLGLFISLCVMGRVGGLVVSVLVFYYNNPSLNPAEPYSLFCKMFVIKQKRSRGWAIKKLPYVFMVSEV